MNTTSIVLLNKKIFVSKYATFLEKKFIKERGSGKNIEFEKVQNLQTIPEKSMDDPQEILNQMNLRMRYFHNTHFLFEDQIECDRHL